MATIADLKPAWNTLEFNDKLEIIREVRTNRLQIKPAKTKTDKKRREVKSSQLRALEKMSNDELDLLLKRLEAKRDDNTET